MKKYIKIFCGIACFVLFILLAKQQQSFAKENTDDNLRIQNGVLYEYDGDATELNIPDGVTRIGIEALANCHTLERITLPNGLKEIGENAFMGCEKLTSIVIPDSVEVIDKSAFYA